MSPLTIYKEDNSGSTVVSNLFIDEYLTEANDAQIKVYLYLLRMMSANMPVSISDLADKFNHTEKDIIRALKYWEKRHLLCLSYDDNKAITGVRFLNPGAELHEEVRPLAPIVPLKLVATEEQALVSAPLEAPAPEPVKPVRETPSYSRDQLKQFKESPETSQVLFLAETYLQKNLTSTDVQNLFFIHHELSFSVDLTDYLLQYCVEKGKKNFSYIKTVAIDWADSGITTPEQAKDHIGSNVDKNVYTIMKALGRNTTPTEVEIGLITKWYKEYGFSMDIIERACSRTVISTDSHRLEYCDKILQSWKKKNVKTLSDIDAVDSEFVSTPRKTSKPASATKNSFNQFQGRSDYDFNALEQSILGNQ